MKNKKNIPVWYRMMIEKRLKKLEHALKLLDMAEECIALNYFNVARAGINYVIEYSKK